MHTLSIPVNCACRLRRDKPGVTTKLVGYRVAGEKIYIHIVWSPTTGPIMAYVRDQTAHDHARGMLGVKVDECELRESLAPEAVDDVYVAELEDFDDDTPVDDLPPPPPPGPKKCD